MQNNRPESVLKWQGIGDVKTAIAFLLQLIDDEEFAESLNLTKKVNFKSLVYNEIGNG